MKFFPRIPALFLSLILAVPRSALALREQPIREKKPVVLGGLEEALNGNPDDLLQLASAALSPAASSSSPVPAWAAGRPKLPRTAGAEEGFEYTHGPFSPNQVAEVLARTAQRYVHQEIFYRIRIQGAEGEKVV